LEGAVAPPRLLSISKGNKKAACMGDQEEGAERR
jgi:hypothetical protein